MNVAGRVPSWNVTTFVRNRITDMPHRHALTCLDYREQTIVVGEVVGPANGRGPTKDIASRQRVVRPSVDGVAGHAGSSVRVDPVALEPIAITVRHVPAGRLKTAVVVGEVDVARGDIRILAAYNVAGGSGVGTPARGGGIDEAIPDVGALLEPVTLKAI